MIGSHRPRMAHKPDCGTVIDLDLTVKRRDPNAPIRIALDDVQCPRTRIMALSRYPSI